MNKKYLFNFWMYVISYLPFMIWIPVIISNLFHPHWFTLIPIITLSFSAGVITARHDIKNDEILDLLKELKNDKGAQ